MKFFQNLLGKDNRIAIAAPVAGKLVSIREVNDPTFGEEILGKGVHAGSIGLKESSLR